MALSAELIAILVTSLIEVTEVGLVGWLLYRTYTKMGADDAALYLQGRKIEEILKEMQQSLQSAR
jgi:hypothetical protein